jgi:DNA (cytosine-5)-methyltransferase 1
MSDQLIIDSFAGGGGASTGIEMALGRSPDIAINHDSEAVALHRANHPETLHVESNIWKANPDDLVGRRRVGLFWASPDCKHFSKAKGGKPVKRNIRDLAWAVVLWARRARPRVIILENVEEFQDWGPLIEREPGKWAPCPERKGETFKRWIGELKRLGYKVQWRELRACDYGAPTIRKRLILVARCDGVPIEWPEPTHGAPGDPEVVAGRKLPWRTAADIIDWSLDCPSIFLTKEEARAIGCKRPLADATMARIARGVKRYVLDAAEPFIVSVAHGYSGGRREYPIDDPLGTVSAGGIQHGVVQPFVAGVGGRMGQSPERPVTKPAQTLTAKADSVLVAPVISYGQQGGANRAPDDPLHTVTASKKDTNCVVAPFLAPRYGERAGQDPRTHPADEPSPPVVPTGNGHRLAAVHLAKFRGDSGGVSVDRPMPTVTANSYVKRPGGAPPLGVVAAFLAQHNGGPRPVFGSRAASEPISSVTASGAQQAIVSAGLLNLKGSDRRMAPPDAPTPTQTSGGWHQAEVRAFLLKYYGNEAGGHDMTNPLGTTTTRERFGLVTVEGEPYEIVDIGMRMLSPRELFSAQGFPDSYVIDRGMLADRTEVPMTKTASIRMCGNSVCPPLAQAIVAANCPDLAVTREAAE